MSFALPSPGHQLTRPEGGGTQSVAKTVKSEAFRENIAATARFNTRNRLIFIFIFCFVVWCCKITAHLRRLTFRAQARGTNQREPRSGTGPAIPRCLQRFVRWHSVSSGCKACMSQIGRAHV